MTSNEKSVESQISRCPACGRTAVLEPAFPEGEALCHICVPLLQWLAEHYGPEIRLKTSFTDDLGADSLDVAELLMQLEDRMGVALGDDESTRIRTVGDAIGAIARQLNNRLAG